MVAKSQFKFFDQLIMYGYISIYIGVYDMGPFFSITQCPKIRKKVKNQIV